jgi:hypothetical protein
MKKMLAVAAICLLGVVAQAAVGLVDDFSGDLSAWTSTVILDANGGAANTAAWQITGETLELATTAYDGIQQYAMTKSGVSLGIGEELQVDIIHSGASQDLGLYVGGTTPVAGTRQDYIAVYARHTGELFTRGFNGTAEYGQVGWISPAYEKLFIARIAANTFEVGYYEGGVRNIMTTRTPTTANEADVIGFYADVRGTGTLGNADNLTIVPEPATLVLLGLGGLLLKRRKA